MGVTENKEVVRAFMEAMRKGQISTCRSMLTDNIIATIPRSGEIMGNARMIQGAEDVLKAKALVRDSYYTSEMEFHIKATIAEGDFVASFLEIVTALPNGKKYSNDYIFFFRFEDGKIAEWDESTDTAYVYQEFGYRITKDPA